MIESKDSNPKKPKHVPQVYKETQLETMIQLIQRGIYSTTNLSTALHIDMSTIVEWKKRLEVKQAHTRSILKHAGNRTDVDGILKELGLETAQREEQSNVRVIIEDYGSKGKPPAKAERSDRSK